MVNCPDVGQQIAVDMSMEISNPKGLVTCASHSLIRQFRLHCSLDIQNSNGTRPCFEMATRVEIVAAFVERLLNRRVQYIYIRLAYQLHTCLKV